MVWRHYMALDAATWYATSSAGGSKASLAGIWYGYVSLPIFQFLLCRWYFRLIIWMRFLWQVSRITLRLVATHPDRVGGLGFLASTAEAFTLLAVAHGALLSGQLANRILFLGATLPDFKVRSPRGGVSGVLVIGPLLIFAPQLMRAKRRACVNSARLPSVTCGSSMPSGCEEPRRRTSRSWAAPTSSPSRISETASRLCGRCGSRR